MMADNQLLNGIEGDGGGDDVFVYTGGEQQVPLDVKRVRIAENIDTIPATTFEGCAQLIEVEGHNRLKKIEEFAFHQCRRLRRLTKMTAVIEIEKDAFCGCDTLGDMDFDKLEIIGYGAFAFCKSLRSVNMPSVRSVGPCAFARCYALTDVVFGKDLERIVGSAFFKCIALRRIIVPLKDDLIIDNLAFALCENLSRFDTLAGEINKTISSLHMESWRDDMEEEIDSINQTLPNIQSSEKAGAIQQWIARVLSRMEHYKTEHQMLIKEAMALLELVLWKANLLKEADEKKCNVAIVAKKAKIDAETAREDHRVTCGASIVIKNVLPFLALK